MKIQSWTMHGERATKANLLAAVLPARGVHALVGHDAKINTAIAADLAVAIAAGPTGCGLGLPDQDGVRHSLAGFFGLPAGEASGVAYVASTAAAGHAIEAAALARGVTRDLPIATKVATDFAGAVWRGDLALDRIRDNMPRRLALLIVEANVSDNSTARANLVNALNAAEGVIGAAVLLVSQSDVAGVVTDGVVLEASEGRLTLANPVLGRQGWTKAFSCQRIALGGGEAIAIVPGEPLKFAPKWKAPKPVATPAAVAAPEPEIVERVVVFGTNRSLEPAELAPWADYRTARDERAALKHVENSEGGGVREILIVPTDRDNRAEEAGIRKFKLEQEARARGIDHRVLIRISERRVAA